MFSLLGSTSISVSRPSTYIPDIGRGINLLKGLKGCYDSLPAVNSDTSLPIISFGLGSFPNYRFSFLPYLTSKRDYSDAYEKEIETSPYPFGYEHEDCFIKHHPFSHGKNYRECIIEKDKYISSRKQQISISYIHKSNTYIVQVSFINEDRSVFFKQTNKLIKYQKDKIKWNSRDTLSSEFSRRLLKHIGRVDPNLFYVLDRLPEADLRVSSYRTVLNNPFWKETKSLFLLPSTTSFRRNTRQKNLLKKCQYHFRNKKDYLSKSDIFDGLPSEYVKVLMLNRSFEVDKLPFIKELYDTLSAKVPEKLSVSFMGSFDYNARAEADLKTYLQDSCFIDFVKSDTNPQSNILSLLTKYKEYVNFKKDLLNVNKVKTLQQCNNDYDLHLKEILKQLLIESFDNCGVSKEIRSEIKFKEGDRLIINPSPEDYLSISLSVPPLRSPIFNGKILNSSGVLEKLPLNIILNNTEILKAKGILKDELEENHKSTKVEDGDIEYGW